MGEEKKAEKAKVGRKQKKNNSNKQKDKIIGSAKLIHT